MLDRQRASVLRGGYANGLIIFYDAQYTSLCARFFLRTLRASPIHFHDYLPFHQMFSVKTAYRTPQAWAL